MHCKYASVYKNQTKHRLVARKQKCFGITSMITFDCIWIQKTDNLPVKYFYTVASGSTKSIQIPKCSNRTLVMKT